MKYLMFIFLYSTIISLANAQTSYNLVCKDDNDFTTIFKINEISYEIVFLGSMISDKDKASNTYVSTQSSLSIDLHGYTLDQANNKVRKLILSCFEKGIRNINIITGKGNRSNNEKNPYQSKDLSILKYAVPDYITNNSDLMDKILKIDQETVNEASSGSFNIFLKKN